MYNIIKMDPYKTHYYPHLLNIIKSLGVRVDSENDTNYTVWCPVDSADLTRDDLYKCKNSLYLIVKDCQDCKNTNSCIHATCAAVGLVKSNMKEANISELSYYCQDNAFVYSIKFFAYNADVDISILQELIGGLINDRNDAFITYETESDDVDFLCSIFEYCGFKIYPKEQSTLFIKEPTSAPKKETELG